MNKIIISALLATLGLSGVCGAQSLAEKEASALSKFRKNSGDVRSLVALAQIREARGKWSEASATWGLVKSKFGGRQSTAREFGKGMLYSELADWWRTRLARRRGVKQASSAQKRAAERAYRAKIKDPNVHAERGDMDGDGLPEIAYGVTSRPDADGYLAFYVEKWGNNRYETVWSTKDEEVPIIFSFARGAWPAIYLNYGDRPNVGTRLKGLRSNGSALVRTED